MSDATGLSPEHGYAQPATCKGAGFGGKRQLIMEYQYFKIKKKNREYKGLRYFRFKPDAERTLQVCISQGSVKKGRSRAIGIYEISRMSFLSNYYGMNYIFPCTEIEFKTAFNQVIKKLK